MQIKRFEAKTMAEALQRIKAELGPEAVILSARSIGKGRLFPGLRKEVEVTAAVDQPGADIGAASRPALPSGRATEAYARRSRTPGSPPRRDAVSRAGTAEPPPTTRAAVVRTPLYRHLTDQEVSEDLAQDLTTEYLRLCRRHSPADPSAETINLRGSLEKAGFAARSLHLSGRTQKRVVLLGASGVGKTTTLLKLAVRQARDHGQRVALVSLDDLRLGAWDPLRLVADALQLRLTTGSLQSDARAILKENRAADLVLFDTPAVGPGDDDRIRELARLVRRIKPSDICFLAAATARPTDQAALIRRLGPVALTGIGFTKVDESTRPAGLLNLLARIGKPALLFTGGPRIPEDLADGSLRYLAAKIGPGDRNDAPAAVEPAAESVGKHRKPAPFVANGSSDIYHRRDCKWTHVMKVENIVCFDSAAEAESRDFKPCRACCRDRLHAEFRGPLAPIPRQAAAVGR